MAAGREWQTFFVVQMTCSDVESSGQVAGQETNLTEAQAFINRKYGDKA